MTSEEVRWNVNILTEPGDKVNRFYRPAEDGSCLNLEVVTCSTGPTISQFYFKKAARIVDLRVGGFNFQVQLPDLLQP